MENPQHLKVTNVLLMFKHTRTIGSNNNNIIIFYLPFFIYYRELRHLF